MFQVKLVLRNSKHRGKRLAVNRSPFSIGRNDKCELRLGGNTVSRRHCVIRIEQAKVTIEDRKSRNGVLVNGVRIPASKLFLVWNGDKIQIGEWKLSLRIKDSEGNAVTKHYQQSVAILGELDEISAAMEAGTTTWHELGESSPDQSESKSIADSSDLTAEIETASTPDESKEVVKEPPAAQLEVIEPKVQAEADSSGEARESEADSEPAGPKKLPKHLRPTGPADSQDAADQALRKLFQR